MIALADLFDRIKNLSPLARIVLFSCGGLFIIGVMIMFFTVLFWPTPHSATTRRDTTTTSTAQPSPLLFGTNLTLIDRHDQVLTSAATRDLLQRIHPESVRMPVRTDLPEAVEVQAAQIIKRLGAVPVVSLQGSLDPHVLSDDTAIITTMNKIFGTSVVYYEFGNEEDLVGVPADRYTTSWNAIVPLLKVLAPQAQFVGPVTYHADPSYLKSFLQKAQPRPDEVSWHEYTCTQADPETTCLSHLADWSTHLNTARSIMTAVMGRALPIMITEWNYAPNATPTDGKSNDNGFMSTWTQKALQTLIANHVFAAMQYSCTNTPTALVSSTNTLTVQGAVFLAEAQRAVAMTQHSNTPSLEPATATTTLPGSLTPIATTMPSNSATPPAPTVQPTATTALPTLQPSPSPSPTPTPTPVPPTPTPTPRSVLPTPTPTPTLKICFARSISSNLIYLYHGQAFGSTGYFSTLPYPSCYGSKPPWSFTWSFTSYPYPPVALTLVRLCLLKGPCGSWVNFTGVGRRLFLGSNTTLYHTELFLQFQGFGASTSYTVHGILYYSGY